MVKIGFISEGKSDRTILNSEKFRKYLEHNFGITYTEEEVLYGGGKSKIKTDFISLIQNLYKKGVEYVFIMVDQDDKEAQRKNRKYKPVDCPMIVVDEIRRYRGNRHYFKDNQIFIVMTREMEAWFLADSELSLNRGDQQPEEVLNPSDLVGKQLGTSSHGRIAHKLKDKFSIARAAENAPSARRFLKKLEQISQN